MPKVTKSKATTKPHNVIYQADIHEPMLEKILKEGKSLPDFYEAAGINADIYSKWKQNHLAFRRIHHKYLGMDTLTAGNFYGDASEFHPPSNKYTQYDPTIHDEALYETLASGALGVHFCKRFRISKRTLRHWINTHPSFYEAYEEGLAAGEAFWLDLPMDGRGPGHAQWNSIMRYHFKWGHEPLVGCRGQLKSGDILSMALDALGSGTVSGRTFDQLVHAADVKMKSEQLDEVLVQLKEVQDEQKRLGATHNTVTATGKVAEGQKKRAINRDSQKDRED